MQLKDLLTSLANTRPIAKNTLANYERAVRYFCDFIGREGTVADLETGRVNLWLTNAEMHYSAEYCVSLRRDFLVCWQHAGDLELCKHPNPRLIRKSKVANKSPSAWPNHWMPKLIEAADRMEGRIKRYGIERSMYATAYLLVQASILARPSDMRSLLWNQVQGDGMISFVQHKTGILQKCKLDRKAFHALNRLRGLDPVYCFPLSKTATEELILRLFKTAGIDKPKGQSLGHLRHSGGTAIAAKFGNDKARQALGHAPGSRVFEKNYLDSSKIPPVESATWWE